MALRSPFRTRESSHISRASPNKVMSCVRAPRNGRATHNDRTEAIHRTGALVSAHRTATSQAAAVTEPNKRITASGPPME